ncbi:MAG: rod shape-determining protein MreD [gamma proteobacterium symbiont of Lucinoma myriamae]|nr:rod shape-determining protein MreD [gamma proteobacterium symbiont of Lucinoma myriamae]MCU7817934.1 rod shape-determining protein MreD [gamma proteobacterium symbiont of Lucinoma myriamae]MCU7831313.1 rod shape-determining protein MreD [gamma proteobacterium symbiont of Lucinoma myriamae]
MSNRPISHGGIIIWVSFAVAFILTMIPMSEELEMYRPQWVTLILIYWCLALPHRVGIFTGWFIGFLLDIHMGSILGQHALTLAIIAYLSYRLHIRIRLYPLVQQSLIILLLVTLSQMILLWISGIVDQAPGDWSYWLPSLTSMLVWPWVFYLMRGIRRIYGVN